MELATKTMNAMDNSSTTQTKDLGKYDRNDEMPRMGSKKVKLPFLACAKSAWIDDETIKRASNTLNMEIT